MQKSRAERSGARRGGSARGGEQHMKRKYSHHLLFSSRRSPSPLHGTATVHRAEARRPWTNPQTNVPRGVHVYRTPFYPAARTKHSDAREKRGTSDNGSFKKITVAVDNVAVTVTSPAHLLLRATNLKKGTHVFSTESVSKV